MEIEAYGMLTEKDSALLRQTPYGLSLVGGRLSRKELETNKTATMFGLDEQLSILSHTKLIKSFNKIGIKVRTMGNLFAIRPQIFGNIILTGYAIPMVFVDGSIDVKKSKLVRVSIDTLVDQKANNQLISEGYLRKLIHSIALKYKVS